MILPYNILYQALLGFPPYSSKGFFDICLFASHGVRYPIHLTYANNKTFTTVDQLPPNVLSNAGVQSRPSSIPKNLWVLPGP